jgi:hypothetical protein
VKKKDMWTTSCIKRHINNLPDGVLFTTRDFLSYGSRSAVDQALYRLVKSGRIRRVVRGVFIKPDYGRPPVSASEVAIVKAQAFGRRILKHCADVAFNIGLISEVNHEPTFATNGSSTSFRFRETTIHFKGIGPRKMALGDSRSGWALRSLIYLGQDSVNAGTIQKAALVLNRTSRKEVRLSGHMMPSWLASQIVGPGYVSPADIDSRVAERIMFESAFRTQKEITRFSMWR